MLSVLDDMVRRHRHSGVIVDTNLLVLFLIGSVNRAWIGQFKRTADYTVDDYELLALMVGEFDTVIVTPNVLTEISNLCGQLPDALKAQFFIYLSHLLPTPVVTETYVPSVEVAVHPDFPRLGLTDVSVERAASEGHPVLTDDFPLYRHLCDHGLEAFNFNHVRYLALR